MSKSLFKTKQLFTKSLTLSNNLKKGHIIRLSDLCLKKPGTGIGYKYINKIVGKKLLRNITSKELIRWSDFD